MDHNDIQVFRAILDELREIRRLLEDERAQFRIGKGTARKSGGGDQPPPPPPGG